MVTYYSDATYTVEMATVISSVTGQELLLEAVRPTNNRKLLIFVALGLMAAYLVKPRSFRNAVFTVPKTNVSINFLGGQTLCGGSNRFAAFSFSPTSTFWAKPT